MIIQIKINLPFVDANDLAINKYPPTGESWTDSTKSEWIGERKLSKASAMSLTVKQSCFKFLNSNIKKPHILRTFKLSIPKNVYAPINFAHIKNISSIKFPGIFH